MKYLRFRDILLQELCYKDHQWDSTTVVLKLFAKNVFDILKKAPLPLFWYLQVYASKFLFNLEHLFFPWNPYTYSGLKNLAHQDLLSHHLPPQRFVLTLTCQESWVLLHTVRWAGTDPGHLGQILFIKCFIVKLIYRLIISLKKRRGMFAWKHR